MRRLIVRWQKRNGQACSAALLSTLSPREVLDLPSSKPGLVADPQAVALTYAYLCDKRGHRD